LDHQVCCSLIVASLHDLLGFLLGRQQITYHQASGPKLIPVIFVLIGPSVWCITTYAKRNAERVQYLHRMKQRAIFQSLASKAFLHSPKRIFIKEIA
jgi:hypothetical protein